MHPVDWICVAMLVPAVVGAIGLLLGIVGYFAREAIAAVPRVLGARWRAGGLRFVPTWRKSARTDHHSPALRPSLPAA